MRDYVSPAFNEGAFNCPHCAAYAHQSWFRTATVLSGAYRQDTDLVRCQCAHCREYSIWHDGSMVFPRKILVELPSPDLPPDCKVSYDEAREVVGGSTRAAAALLRLCIQQLMPHLDEGGKQLNDAIGALVDKGLPPLIQKALDICRVIGNNAVHPGEIDLNDTPTIAHDLFRLVNLIVEDRITRPREIEALYSSLPESAREAIAKRDGIA